MEFLNPIYIIHECLVNVEDDNEIQNDSKIYCCTDYYYKVIKYLLNNSYIWYIINPHSRNFFTSFIEKLNKLNTTNVEPLTSVVETTLKLRTDEVKSKDIRNKILKNSPEVNEDFFVVPKVVE